MRAILIDRRSFPSSARSTSRHMIDDHIFPTNNLRTPTRNGYRCTSSTHATHPVGPAAHTDIQYKSHVHS